MNYTHVSLHADYRLITGHRSCISRGDRLAVSIELHHPRLGSIGQIHLDHSRKTSVFEPLDSARFSTGDMASYVARCHTDVHPVGSLTVADVLPLIVDEWRQADHVDACRRSHRTALRRFPHPHITSFGSHLAAAAQPLVHHRLRTHLSPTVGSHDTDDHLWQVFSGLGWIPLQPGRTEPAGASPALLHTIAKSARSPHIIEVDEVPTKAGWTAPDGTTYAIHTWCRCPIGPRSRMACLEFRDRGDFAGRTWCHNTIRCNAVVQFH